MLFIQHKRKGHLDTALVMVQSQAESPPPLHNAGREVQAIAQLDRTTPLASE